jgi:hypothetical protein
VPYGPAVPGPIRSTMPCARGDRATRAPSWEAGDGSAPGVVDHRSRRRVGCQWGWMRPGDGARRRRRCPRRAGEPATWPGGGPVGGHRTERVGSHSSAHAGGHPVGNVGGRRTERVGGHSSAHAGGHPVGHIGGHSSAHAGGHPVGHIGGYCAALAGGHSSGHMGGHCAALASGHSATSACDRRASVAPVVDGPPEAAVPRCGRPGGGAWPGTPAAGGVSRGWARAGRRGRR